MSMIRHSFSSSVPFAAAVLLAGAMFTGGCQRDAVPTGPVAIPTPVQAVDQLIDDLRANDLLAYADHALPPALHERMTAAWSEGRTTWPLTRLPLGDRLPGFITTLAEPDAEKTLLASFHRQFAGADRELRIAASTLGLFTAQYVEGSSDYSEPEREHYVQLIAALAAWGQQAPLADTARAKAAVPQLVAAARLTGLGHADALQQAGMERSLTRLGPMLARLKLVLADYGLAIDPALAGAQTRLIEQTGDQARVALDYHLAGTPINAELLLERQDGRWYLSDLIRHAEQQAAMPAADAPQAPAAAPRPAAAGSR